MAKTRKKKSRSIYGVHPGVQMMAKWIAGLKEKTGRTLDEWAEQARTHGPDNEKDGRAWFKAQGLGTNGSWYLAEYVWGKGWIDGDADTYMEQAKGYVRDMYAGAKAGLKPLHDAILEMAAELGDDVKACPCQTIVPLYRKHVFAQIKPSTRTRIDLGVALGKYAGEFSARLIDTGGKAKGDRITHRIAITQLSDLDAEVQGWLQAAYELDE